MKRFLVMAFALVLLFSCEKTDKVQTDNYLIGKWKQIEVLADPGDGSGTFQPVISNKTIEFRTDETVTSNGSLCFLSVKDEEQNSGTYSLNDSSISSNDCADRTLKIYFETEDGKLILNYPCIEPCRAKFEKI